MHDATLEIAKPFSKRKIKTSGSFLIGMLHKSKLNEAET